MPDRSLAVASDRHRSATSNCDIPFATSPPGAGLPDMDIRFRCDASARLIAAAAMLSVAVRGAHADAREDDAIASRLYNEGRVLAEQGRWPDACAKFEASQRRDPALGTSLSLARCYETIGKLDGAWQSYRKAAELAGRAGNLVRRDFAQARAEALELRLANVAIEIPDLPASGPRDSQRAPAATEIGRAHV